MNGGRELGADPGGFFSLWVVAAGNISKDLMSLYLGMMLRFVINISSFKKRFICVFCQPFMFSSGALENPKI